MKPTATWVLTEDYAGLHAQALGLAEAAGLAVERRVLRPRGIWRHVPAVLWPVPLAAISPESLAPPLPELLIGAGGKAAPVVAALARRVRGVMVQHPRMSARRFDLIIAARHDELTGPNVIVTRTALHRVTPERLAEAAAVWRPRFAHLPRPLVSVLVGGANGRFRLDAAVAARLAAQLAAMMRQDHVGLALTPSRRTDPAVTRVLAEALAPLGAMVWDGEGENPYFGMLALADVIVVTMDSVSMISEAAATRAPVLVAPLPGRSRRQRIFLRGLIDDGRVRLYQGRFEHWPVVPVDDTRAAAEEMCHRFGY
jgi:mitochondrial fission protein ELM1